MHFSVFFEIAAEPESQNNTGNLQAEEHGESIEEDDAESSTELFDNDESLTNKKN